MRRLLLALPLVAATAAQAHETVSRQWCADGHRMTIASFHFGANLVDAVTNAPPSCQGTCGEPDDDYRRVTGFTQEFCAGEEDLRSIRQGDIRSGDVGDIVAIVQGPPSFLAASHHSGYLMPQGVWGICVLCAPVATAPPPPPPRRGPSR